MSSNWIKFPDLDGFRKYPSLRDHPLKTAAKWIQGRRLDDDCGDLWRVHDKLYDLKEFVNSHPGGRQWIEITRGTDVTEAFESSHLNSSALVDSILKKYYRKDADSQRNSPYTFHPDGFYATLKKNVYAHLQRNVTKEEKEYGRQRVRKVQDLLVGSFFLLLTLAAVTDSYMLAMLAGAILMMNINCAHNFYHQRDSWRMYCWDLGLLSSYEWRVTHALSHHGYTNSLLDFELSDFEPYFDFRVHEKSFVQRYLSFLIGIVSSPLFFFMEATKRIITIASGQQKLRPENLLPFAQLVFIYLLNGNHLISSLKLWLVVQSTASCFFGIFGIVAAHHHPDLYHAGDGRQPTDWGLAQLDAVRDRNDVNGILLFELSTYGNHILHHLFPTVDHGVLDSIRPVFQSVCRQFKLPKELYESPSTYNQLDLFFGMIRQTTRIDPRKISLAKSL